MDWVCSNSNGMNQSVFSEFWDTPTLCDPEYKLEPGVLLWQFGQVVLFKHTDSKPQGIV